jgi:hypothetical protein
MRSILLSGVLAAISLGLIGLTPSNAEAQRWLYRSYYYPAYSSNYYAPGTVSYYPSTSYYYPSSSYYYPSTSYYVPETTTYYSPPVYSTYSYPAYSTYSQSYYYPRRYINRAPVVTYSAYPTVVY